MSHVRACVRLQFHKDFNFDKAVGLLDYFSSLGISHIYSSPILKARPGSQHGYDVVDPTRVNPELGGEEGLRRLVNALRERGMGFIADFVPNHMAVGGADNPWWLDVLEWGMRSPFAQFFDIQWNSPDPVLKGQPLVPFLRTDYGEALNGGEITLHFSAEDGVFYAQHFEHRFPLYPPSYPEILNLVPNAALRKLAQRFEQLAENSDCWRTARSMKRELCQCVLSENLDEAIKKALCQFNVPAANGDSDNAGSPDSDLNREEIVQRMHRLLERQNYRLASWRSAADDINWRRFFDINELAGVRMEEAHVFEAVHEKMFELIERGLVDGLRIDHVDGLANPRAYCHKLRQRVSGLLQRRPAALQKLHFPIYVEKILGGDEQLPVHWRVDGTTGYEFMNQISLVQHDPAGAEPLLGVWAQITGRSSNFHEETIEARRLVLTTSLAGDFESIAQNLLLIARNDIYTRDFTLAAIRRALLELIAHFPVYRTYATACPRARQDQEYFDKALTCARAALAENEGALLDHLNLWLGGEPLHQLPPGPIRELRRKTLARFQQLTSATAAKAVEDTACYRSAALLSRNDVGFDPCEFSVPVNQFHSLCQARLESFPHNLLTTATHDHKRGEDTRARLAVISEKFEWFIAQVAHWRILALPLRQETEDGVAPSAGDELMLYQTLLATWPFDLNPEEATGEKMATYLKRLCGWQEKSMREAKLRTSWSAPNARYEEASRHFLTMLLSDASTGELRQSIAETAMALAPAGAINSLTQTLLRMTTPGVPDLYQGTEFWDFSLVDPDNRRPVDFAERVAALEQFDETSNPSHQLLQQWRAGHIKQFLIRQTLNCRREFPDVFADGDYWPVAVEGENAEHVIAFIRRLGNRLLLVIAPRLPATLLDTTELPLIPSDRWGDTRLTLPGIDTAQGWQSLINQKHFEHTEGFLRDFLAEFPVNILLGQLDTK